MVVKPFKQNAQVQRLTTALKNICRDYPAGGTVLRELLQNADDAGANEVRFFLDETNYSIDELLDDKLKQYQGPALLAYNNAVFRDKDFESLSRLGDSLKLNDGLTTGKFGRGFNSVYNWTDSPSIVSRERLLILDPHREWSDGGPVYDFVENSNDPAIKNHMLAFQNITKSSSQPLDQPLDGTIIRIPLRTGEQALKSDISNRATTVCELEEVLQSFASEFGDSGLLFMRNVEKIELGSANMSIVIQMKDKDGKTLRSHKEKINDAVKQALNDMSYSFDYSFESVMEYSSAKQSTKTTFAVHHSIYCDSLENGLQDWARNQKLIPWVAIATQIPSSETPKASFFTVLPVPIPTNQPVHIHGLFSISPDRARLYHFRDRSTQDQDPAKWNKWLLQDKIPITWTKLLLYLADIYPEQPAFEMWPRSVDNPDTYFATAIESIMRIIGEESYALWPTHVGYVNTQNGLLSTGPKSQALKDALREAKVPVVYVPSRLESGANILFGNRNLCARSLCQFLKAESSRVRNWSDQTKHQILEYLLSDSDFIGYDELELFPFKDGMYRSIGQYVAFIHRDEREEDLFSLDNSHNLDLKKLSETTQQVLKQRCNLSTIHPSIRYRSASCLREYCMNYIFGQVTKDQDMIVLDKECATLVVKVWDWILDRGIGMLDDDISCLWLLPLSNGQHRKMIPESSSLHVYLTPEGELGDFMRRFNRNPSVNQPLLLDIEPTGLASYHVSLFKQSLDTLPKLCLKDASNIAFFVEWLHQTSPLLDDASDAEKKLVANLIAKHLPQQLTSSERGVLVEALKHLKIFQRVTWEAEGNKMRIVPAWTNLRSCSKSVGLLDGIIPIPQIDNFQFLIAEWSSSSKRLLDELGLADCIDSLKVIQDHIVPAWESEQTGEWDSSSKEQISKFILQRFSLLSTELRTKLRSLPIVSVMKMSGEKTSKFARAEDLIDPSILSLKRLYFEDEKIYPKQSFFQDFNIALKECGLRTAVDDAIVEHRVYCYANSQYSLSDIHKRARRLLKSPVYWNLLPEKYETSNLRRFKWLPAVDSHGKLSLKSAAECRSHRDRLLVSSQLAVLNFDISSEWEVRLGWDTKLPSHTLLSQLRFGSSTNNRNIVDAIFTYISGNGLIEQLAEDLRSIACIPIFNGTFIRSSQAVRPPRFSINRCDRLQPYLANVERKFWDDHKRLLIKLEIEELCPTHLLQIQASLETKPELEEPDISVAIEILNLASKFQVESLAGLKIISEAGTLHPIHDINFNDLGHLKSKQNVNLTHPDIPSKTIRNLRIGNLSERLIKGLLEIEDIDDEDEFDQRETVTTRIADTLDRYPVETTFREYLANADDAQRTSKISWLLDERIHAQERLLTPELKEFQGPALLVQNDGVFSDDDFKGLKNVGEGSKANNRETIGQFGRGSQTMYHWTDVPMILSGNWLLILDPQQKYLPVNYMKGRRKPGVKLLLSKLKEACPDQLTPFQGLWDFTGDLDYYNGTIFRFPLRTPNTISSLRVSERYLDFNEAKQLMTTYFDEARISLLFLRHIKSIDFNKEDPKSGWEVTKETPLVDDVTSFSEPVICRIIKNIKLDTQYFGRDKWWVAIEDLQPAADRLPQSSRRVMKNVECGIAALISSKSEGHNLALKASMPMQSKLYNTLPLPISSDLPIHIHATFMLSGDRQSIAIDEYGAPSHGSEWNRYLLQEALPKLYLSFLDDIGPQVRQDVFKYWPHDMPPKRSCAELLCDSLWRELPNSSNRLFPKAQPTNEVSRRRAPERYDINQAVFDFLSKEHSEILAPLLISMDINLVHDVPLEVQIRLKALPKVKAVTTPMLRSLFKSDVNRCRLLENMKTNPRILEVLLYHLIPANTELEDLDGCQVLLLADGSLAKLKSVEAGDIQTPRYYMATEKELKLFDFASSRLALLGTISKLEPVSRSGNFNLTRLQLKHVKDLLKMKPHTSKPNAEDDKWLTKFWTYWNESTYASQCYSDIHGLEVKIYRATHNDDNVYISPQDFDGLPAVVEPSVSEHQQLCSKIHGLYCLNTNFMPKSLVGNENSLHKADSFYRFIRALRRLAVNAGMKIGTFVETRLNQAQVKVLRNLVVWHVSDQIQSPESKHFLEHSADLKSIPLWPSAHASSREQMISANDAHMVGDRRLLVSWMKDYYRFIDFEFLSTYRNRDYLAKLGVKELSVEVLLRDHVLPLLSTLSSHHWHHYKPLIAMMSESSSVKLSHSFLGSLRWYEVAADGNRNLRRTSDFFDHDDQIFISAFRHQQDTKFLHDSVQSYRSFWLKVGLRYRQNGYLNLSHYIECLQELNRRLNAEDRQNDPHLGQDCATVLSPLTNPSHTTRCFRANDWRMISHERVFASITAFNAESEYRRDTMALVATQQRILRLADVISHSYAAVCWSQTAFALSEPAKEVLSNIKGKGEPNINMVWQHLQHMKVVAQNLKSYQIRDFLEDLRLTYEYLQAHLEKSKNSFDRDLRKSAIWLNLDTLQSGSVILDDIRSSWHSVEELVLSSSCDAGPIKAVKSGLMEYEKLLKALGCNSIIYPTITRPTLHIGSSVSNSLKRLRDEEKLIDITYYTEGKFIKAHRVVLAAMSEKCAIQFSGNWKDEKLIIYDDDDPDAFLSYHTLSTMIKYAYEDEIDWKEMEVSESDDVDERADKLDLLLDLAKGADFWMIPTLKSQVEDKILVAGKVFINLENVVDIQERAELAGAKVVEQMCADFIKQNREAVVKAHSGMV